MRDIPGLSSDIFARAVNLSEKARAARGRAPVTVASPAATISPAKEVDGVATLRLYDYIDQEGGYWGISANELAEALDEITPDVSRIDLRINSGGGAVWDGLAILNQLRSHPAPITAIVDGIAASAASFIAVACDEVVMMPNSKLMIHDALGICIGQAVDMREFADFLDDSSDNIAEIYAARAGGTAQEWREQMTAKGLLGQWYTAAEAVEAGLADRVGGAVTPEEPEDTTSTGRAAAAPAASTTQDADFTGTHDRRLRLQARRHAHNRARATA
jgi:ATP-dependent protease ClpP protease subunit